MPSAAQIWEAGLGSLRGWFGLTRLHTRRLSDEWARRRLVSRSALLRVNAPFATDHDRELILSELIRRGHTVPLHWLSREASISAERLLLTGQAQIYCDEACTRYLTAP